MYIYFHSMAIYVCIYVYIYVYKHTHLWLAALAASRKCVRPSPPIYPQGSHPPLVHLDPWDAGRMLTRVNYQGKGLRPTLGPLVSLPTQGLPPAGCQVADAWSAWVAPPPLPLIYIYIYIYI